MVTVAPQAKALQRQPQAGDIDVDDVKRLKHLLYLQYWSEC